MKDLRNFLKFLEIKGELLYISKEVNPKFEIAAYIRKSSDEDGPAFLFDNIKGYPDWKVAGGLYGSLHRLKLAFEFCIGHEFKSMKDVYLWYSECMRKRKEIIKGECAPVNEVLFGSNKSRAEKDNSSWQYQEVKSLDDVPICTHNKDDLGPFITGMVQIVKDPETEILGTGIHRMYKIDDNHLSCMATNERRIGRSVSKNLDKGKPTEIVAFVGGPADVLSSQAKLPHDEPKFGVCAALMGTEAKLSKIGNMYVPWDAEVIIFGETVPGKTFADQPFAEFVGTSCIRSNAFVVKVKKIFTRMNPIYETMLTGMPVTEDHILSGMSTWTVAFNTLKTLATEVHDIAFDPTGNYVFTVHVSIKKRMEGEAINVIYGLLATIPIKSVFVYDDDIDVNNPRDRMFAFETRFQPDRDLVVSGHQAVGSSLDPSGALFRHTSKIGFDCTRPIGGNEKEKSYNIMRHKKCEVPGVKEVKW